MSKAYIAAETCSFKVGIYMNRDGNIAQVEKPPVSQKNFTFGGITDFFRFHF